MIYVGDDFFPDPYEVRKIALQQQYTNIEFNYPGLRSRSVPERVSDYGISQIKYFTKNSNLELDFSTFYYTTKEYGGGIYHTDLERYICIVYLSLDAPPNSGTEVCGVEQRGDSVGDQRIIRVSQNFFKDPRNLIKRYKYDRLRKKVNSYYTPMMTVPHKFNRGIIFPAGQWHRAQEFFGTSIENARLTLVFFAS